MIEVLDLVGKMQSKDCSLECNSKEAHSYYTHPVYKQMKRTFTTFGLSLMLHQMIESYKYVASNTSEASKFLVTTDKGSEFTLERDLTTKRIVCHCSFYYMNEMICAHSFCLLNALQIKHINNFDYMRRWRDEINELDPSSRGMMPKAKQ